MKYLICLLTILMATNNATSQKRRGNYFWGVRTGAIFPTNLGRSNHEIGFKDVASTGFTGGILGGWHYNERLSLSTELNYQFLPKNKSFWNVDSKGTFSANYQSTNLLLTGNYYFSNDDWRPFLGASFGLHLLRNMVDFKSKYIGTDNDESIHYIATDWRPGFGFNLGTTVDITKKAQLVFETKLTVIPFLKEQVVPIMDGDVTVNSFTKNPHGNQNQISFTIGLNFQL
ncbi:MAG: hypothetical protein ACWA6U_09355 [Breznakibacter sp.]